MKTKEAAPPILSSELVCSECGARQRMLMTATAPEESFACTTCGACFAPGPYDCCVFCCFGTVPCPVAQAMPEVRPAKRRHKARTDGRHVVKPPFPGPQFAYPLDR
jgi:hypothetical protein